MKTISYTLKVICCSSFVLVLSATQARSQLDIAPTSVVITSESRSSTMLVRNTGSEEREIEVNAFFGYPATDSSGNLFTRRDDSVAAAEHSLMPYLRFFPRKLIIPAGGEQLVKYVVMPRAKMSTGSYWARISIKSVPVVKPIEQTMSGDSVAVRFNLSLERITAAVYINGTVSMALEVGELTTRSDSLVHVMIPMNAPGNSPFWGNAILRIKDSEGNVVDEKFEMLAIYYSMNRKYDFDRRKFKTGQRYTAELTINAEREEIPKRYREHFSNIEKRFDFIAH